MYRSASATRFSDDLSTAAKLLAGLTVSVSDELPVFSDVVKRQRKFPAEAAVHLIPVVLILTGFILWLSSYPIIAKQ